MSQYFAQLQKHDKGQCMIFTVQGDPLFVRLMISWWGVLGKVSPRSSSATNVIKESVFLYIFACYRCNVEQWATLWDRDDIRAGCCGKSMPRDRSTNKQKEKVKQ